MTPRCFECGAEITHQPRPFRGAPLRIAASVRIGAGDVVEANCECGRTCQHLVPCSCGRVADLSAWGTEPIDIR